jgi:hypothetical protein
VIAHHSSHYVMFSQPHLIIDQVRRVVDAVRAGTAQGHEHEPSGRGTG